MYIYIYTHPLTNTPPRCVQSIRPRCGIIYMIYKHIYRERGCRTNCWDEKIGGTWRDRNGKKILQSLEVKT